MGLFSKEACAICGKETRFSKTKLADGNYICSSCLDKVYYKHDILQGIYESVKVYSKGLTLERVKELYDIREKNLEELKKFECTVPLGSNILIDEKSNQIVFFDYFSYTLKNKIIEKNPPVFKMENLAFMHLGFSEVSSSQTVTGKAVAESNAYLIMGFEDPVYDVFKIEIGKLKAKEGLFSDKLKGASKIEEICDYIDAMRNAVITEANATNTLIPANNMDSFWRMLHNASVKGYISSKEVKDYLKQFCGKDKNLIREIKSKYNF